MKTRRLKYIFFFIFLSLSLSLCFKSIFSAFASRLRGGKCVADVWLSARLFLNRFDISLVDSSVASAENDVELRFIDFASDKSRVQHDCVENGLSLCALFDEMKINSRV